MPRLTVLLAWSLFLFSALLLACGGSAAPADPAAPAATATPTPVPTPTPAEPSAALAEPPTQPTEPSPTASAAAETPTAPPATPEPTPTPEPTATPEPTPAPTTIAVAIKGSDMPGMTVSEYAAWCGDRETVTESDNERTNQEVIEALESGIIELQAVTPPDELVSYHAAIIQVATAIKSALSIEPPEETFNPFSLLAVAIIVAPVVEQAERGLSPETYSSLVATGCIEEDPPEPTATPESTPTPTPKPTPALPGSSITNPVEVGGILKGSDGTEIVAVSINGDAWEWIDSKDLWGNGPPEEGYRYYTIAVVVAYPSGDSTLQVSWSDFELVGRNRVIYDSPCVYDLPDELSGEIFAGGKTQGNICFEIPVHESEMMLIHKPGYGAESRRFLRLE